MGDDLASAKERAWREIAAIDEALARGDIDEAGWHAAMADLVVPAYLSAVAPWEGSGHQGPADRWERARRLLVDAIDRPGSFLDVGCANGYLLESLVAWSANPIDPYGLDISHELVALAQERLPAWHDRFWVGNALTWESRRRFTYIRTGLDYVPELRRREYVERLASMCDRLIVGVFNEEPNDRRTERLVSGWGFEIAGRSERPHSDPAPAYRCIWLEVG